MHAPKFCALALWRSTAAMLLVLVAGLALGAGQGGKQGGEAVRAQLFLGPGQQPPHDWRQLQALAAQSGGSAELKRLRDLRHSDKNPNSPQLRQSLVDFAQALNAGVTQVPALVLNEDAPLYSWSSLSREYRRAAAPDRPPAAEQEPPARRTPQLGAATFSLAKLAARLCQRSEQPRLPALLHHRSLSVPQMHPARLHRRCEAAD